MDLEIGSAGDTVQNQSAALSSSGPLSQQIEADMASPEVELCAGTGSSLKIRHEVGHEGRELYGAILATIPVEVLQVVFEFVLAPSLLPPSSGRFGERAIA